ncbi:MAG: hypothetical protein IJ599_02875 [Alphaproteobacteria bacterium]|nr:hypothetical protein [Alphaproteobacteria bacterium]
MFCMKYMRRMLYDNIAERHTEVIMAACSPAM